MTPALSVTGADLIRALRDVMPAIDDAVRQRAEERAAELAADGVTTRVLRRNATRPGRHHIPRGAALSRRD
jgi:hypothetical protein